MKQLTYIPTAKIRPSQTNPRVFHDEKNFNDLKKSIKEKGILAPVLVRETKYGFEIVAGERRFRAAAELCLDTVPAIVQELSDDEAQEIQIIENLQREDVHPLDEASCYQKLIERGVDVKTLAANIGKSNTYIYQRLVLTMLIDDVKKLYTLGKLTTYQAMLFGRLSHNQQLEICKKIQRVIELQGVVDNKTVKDFIVDQHVDLQLAPFALTDDKLDDKAGACSSCPKRTGHNIELFDDIDKDDVCTDRKCFQRKACKHVMQVYHQLRLENKEVMLVKDSWGKDFLKGSLELHEYVRVEKLKDGAILGIIAGGENIGKMIFIRLNQPKETKRDPASVKANETDFEKLHFIGDYTREQLLCHAGEKLCSLKLNNEILQEIALENSIGISDLHGTIARANLDLIKFGKDTESLLANKKTPFDKIIIISRFLHEMSWDYYGNFNKEYILKWSKKCGIDLKAIIKKEKANAKKEWDKLQKEKS